MSTDAYIDIEGLDLLKVKLTDLIRSFSLSKRLMSEIGTFVMTKIKLRTSEGKDVNRKEFEPYSDSYALFRKKEGYPTDKVDLFFTGSMMSSMDYESSPDHVKIYFQNTSGKAPSSSRKKKKGKPSGPRKSREAKNPEKAFWLNEDREFFALSGDDERDISNMVSAYIKKNLF